MTTKQKIKKVLNYSDETYNYLLVDLFITWCESQAYSPNHLQLLITNNKLFNWYLKEYESRERLFLNYIQPFYNSISVKDLRKYYDKETIKTGITTYPSALIKAILKNAKCNAKLTVHNQPSQIANTLN